MAAIETQPCDPHPGEVAAHQRLQRLDAFVGSDRVQHAVGQRAAHPDVRPLAPVDRGRGQARCASPRHQRIEPRVRGCVRQLTRQTRAAKPSKRSRPTSRVVRSTVAACSRNAPATLGAHTRSMLFPGEGGHDTVAGHARSVHDSPQWPSGLLGSRHQPLRHSRLRRYRLTQRRFRRRSQGRRGRASLIIRGIGSTVEDEPPRAALSKPPRDDHAQAAQASGDDVRAIRADDGLVPAVCIERRTREPFDISTPVPPRDHIVSRRRLQFTHQRRDDVVRGIQIDEGGAYIRLAGRGHGPLRRGTASYG